MEPPTHIEIEGEGEDIAKAGHFVQKSIVDLKEISPSEVEVSYKTDVNIVGKLAMFGDRLYGEEDIGQKKVLVARRKLSKLNPAIEIIPICDQITEMNVVRLTSGAQVVLDGLDNFATRLLVNSACVKRKIPYIHGGVSRFRGLITTIIRGETPCLACVYPEGSQEGGGLGVLGFIPAVIANLQVLEAIKLMLGCGPSLAGKLLRFNGNDMKFRIDEIKRNESCKVCSLRLQG